MSSLPSPENLILIGPLLDASFSTKNFPHLEHAPQVAVDGGIYFSPNPVMWFGDGDSASEINGPSPKIALTKKESQNETDLQFCLKQIRNWETGGQKPWNTLHLFGFLGGRRDHELANFGAIHAEMLARKLFLTAHFYENVGVRSVTIHQGGSFETLIHSTFSIFAFTPALCSIQGDCEFTVTDNLLEPFSGRALSNRGYGKVSIHATAPVMIMQKSTPSDRHLALSENGGP